jgi:hypothetical protein
MGGLLPDYFQESLAVEQRNLVEDHLQACERCREEVVLWQKLSRLPQEEPSPGLRARVRAMVDADREGRLPYRRLSGPSWSVMLNFLAGGWTRMPAAGLAWAIVLLGIGFIAGRSLSSHGSSEQQQLARLQEELSSTRQLVTLSLLQQRSASERLQAIAQATAWSISEPRLDPKVMDALLHTLHSDSSVDVRLAAVDALARFHSDPQVRQGLVNALETQQSPLVQVSLIDLMVELKDASVVQQLKKFEQDPNVNPIVRQRAQWGIRQLT